MTEYIVERVSNMIFISRGDEVFEAWDESEFTQRKLNNAMKRIKKNHCGNAVFDIQL